MTAPIPTSCAHRPVTPDGLVVPWANVQLADGGCDFRSHHNARWMACWRGGLCQVCGGRLTLPMVLLAGPNQLGRLLFDEPALHPQCARYVVSACPMVAGRRAHYRTGEPLAHRARGATCPTPGCDCGGWVPTPGRAPNVGGDPAHEWYAVYVRDYQLTVTAEGDFTGGLVYPDDVVRVRLVSRPGEPPLSPWPTVTDWRDRYTAPVTDPRSEVRP